jgi:hypothetical protein
MALGSRLNRMVVEERLANSWRRTRYAGEVDDDDEPTTTNDGNFDEGTPESLATMIAADSVETVAVPTNYYNSDVAGSLGRLKLRKSPGSGVRSIK